MIKTVLAILLPLGLAAATIDVSHDVFVTVAPGDSLSFYAGTRVSGPGYLYFAAGGLVPADRAAAPWPRGTAQYFPGFQFSVTVDSLDPALVLPAGDQPLLAGYRTSHGYSGPIGTVSALIWLPQPDEWNVVRLRNAGEPFTFGYPGYPLKHAFELVPPGLQFAGMSGGGQRRVEWEHVPEPGTAVLLLIGLALLNARLLLSYRRSASR